MGTEASSRQVFPRQLILSPLFSEVRGETVRRQINKKGAGIVDSQSVKAPGVDKEKRGFDGGKKAKGRKRQLLVDTKGFVLEAKVHSAKVMDYEGIKVLQDCNWAKGLLREVQAATRSRFSSMMRGDLTDGIIRFAKRFVQTA